jgi:signal transduction histidine kinase
LAIVKEIIEAHGSKVEVASTPGEGTKFSFTLAAADGVSSEIKAS